MSYFIDHLKWYELYVIVGWSLGVTIWINVALPAIELAKENRAWRRVKDPISFIIILCFIWLIAYTVIWPAKLHTLFLRKEKLRDVILDCLKKGM